MIDCSTMESVLYSRSISYASELLHVFEQLETSSLQALGESEEQPHASIVFLLFVVQLYLYRFEKRMQLSWPSVRRLLQNPRDLLHRLRCFPVAHGVHPIAFQYALPFLHDKRLDLQALQRVSRTAMQIGAWIWLVTLHHLCHIPCKTRVRPPTVKQPVAGGESRVIRCCFRLNDAFYLSRVEIQRNIVRFKVWDRKCILKHQDQISFSIFHLSEVALRHFVVQVVHGYSAQMLTWSSAVVSRDTVWSKRLVLRALRVYSNNDKMCGCLVFHIHPMATLKDLRDKMTSSKHIVSKERYQFYYNGSLLGRSVEKRRLAINCLPVLLIVCLEEDQQALPFHFCLHRSLKLELVPRISPQLSSRTVEFCYFEDFDLNGSLSSREICRGISLILDDCHTPKQVLPPGIYNMASEQRAQEQAKLQWFVEKRQLPLYSSLDELESMLRRIQKANQQKKKKPAKRRTRYSLLPLYCTAVVYSEIEFIIRGIPHEHLAMVLSQGDKIQLEDGQQISVVQQLYCEKMRESKIRVNPPYQGNLRQSTLWRVLKASEDVRQQWLRELHIRVTHPTFDFKLSDKFFEFFKVQILYRELERILEPRHWSRETQWTNYAEALPLERILKVKFKIISHWHPPAECIDGVKFSRFIRDCQIVSTSITVAHIDGVFAQNKDPCTGVLDFASFVTSLTEIAALVNPLGRSTPPKNLAVLFLKHLIQAPSTRQLWFELIEEWRFRAKHLVMEEEAVLICASIRIQAQVRRWLEERKYIEFRIYFRTRWLAARKIQSVARMHGPYLLYRTILTAIVKIQSMARMHLCRKRYLVMLKERDDRVATMMQHWGRRCMFRIKLWRVLNWKWLERQRRVKLKRMRRIYRHSLPINGAMYIIGIYRSHIFAPKNRRYVVEIFQPVTCTMYQLEAHESRVHEIIMASSMKQRHPSECFQSSSDFVAIIQRMLIYKGRLQWSKRQRCMGRYIHRAAYHVNKKFSIVTFYIHALRLSLDIYTPEDKRHEIVFVETEYFHVDIAREEYIISLSFFSKLKNAMINSEVLRTALKELTVKILQHRSPLKPVEKEIEIDPCNGDDEQAAIELLRRREICASIIQRMIRTGLARRRLRTLILDLYIKQYDSSAQCFAYLNQRTGEWSYNKPAFLREDEDLDDPPNEWQMQYNEHGQIYYYNPYYGVSSWINDVQAATRLQKWIRVYRQRDFGNQSMKTLVQALKFQHQATQRYNADPKNLRAMENYAIFLHVIERQFQEAFTLYELGFKFGSSNPISQACFAVLLIASSRPPRERNWRRAQELLTTTIDRFKPGTTEYLADACFCFAVITNPTDAKALANLAAFHQCITKDLDKAERLYRRGLSLHPSDKALNESYCRLVKERYPGGIYADFGPGNIVRQRSKSIQLVHDASGEIWHEMINTEARYIGGDRFYWSPSTGATQWKHP